MPRNPSFEPVRRADGKWQVSVPPIMSPSGKRLRRVFSDSKRAERYGMRLRKVHGEGLRNQLISADMAAEAKRASAMLAPLGIGLIEAARMAVAQLQDEPAREPLESRWNRASEECADRWSVSYAKQIEKLRQSLPRWFMESRCGVIDRPLIEKALRESGAVARSTVDLRTRYVLAVVNFRPRHRRAVLPEIMTTREAAAMLRACRTPAQRYAVALLVWAGVRPIGELYRLRWEDVRADGIHISHEVSKTNTDRIIPISPRLARLLRGRPMEGRVLPPNWKREIDRIRKAAGVHGKHDVARHTFASNFLVACGEESAKNAMGHTENSRTLFRHYRRAVHPAAGRRFFGWRDAPAADPSDPARPESMTLAGPAADLAARPAR